ncbi:MAG: glycosyltransferase, partial [bacterium]|nr:glycosyltransferase [bacterium]
LVHDYIKEFGGAERVLMTLHEMFPGAPIYTIYNRSNKIKAIQSWFGYIPYADRLISPLRFLLPLIWASFNFDKYDLIISSASWAVTKGFSNGKNKEICYCHTPPRILWGFDTSRNWKKHWYIRVYISIINHFMRLYDFNRAQKVTTFIANSLETQKRIKKFYRRDSVVVYPPVDIIDPDGHRDDNYYLTGGRLVLQKNFDLIIKACEKLKIPLKVYGTGPEENYLKSLAGKNTEFLGFVDENKKFELMAGAKAFIIAAGDEDFGITPVEAMGAGTPVIAYKAGGYLETVIENKTGVFFDQLTVDSLVNTVKKFNSLEFNKKDCVKQAQKFSKIRFMKEIDARIT